MGVSTLYSNQITNRDASPRVIDDANITKGVLVETVGTLETVAADASASKYYFCSIPSNARVSYVKLFCDSSGTAGAMDIGLWKSTQYGGAVADQDFFASAQSIATESKVGIDVTHESAAFGLEDVEKPVWEALGLSADPMITYDIVGYVTTAIVDAGTLSIKCGYVI